jgi:hypothetical protein
MTRAIIHLGAMLIVVLLDFDPVQASEHWAAASKNADAITGDVTFDPSQIVFANRISFPIRFLKKIPGLTWMPGEHAAEPAELYKVSDPHDPVILNRNRICGGRHTSAVTYFSVLKSDHEVYLSAYSDLTEPTVSRNNLCAGFRYILERASTKNPN